MRGRSGRLGRRGLGLAAAAAVIAAGVVIVVAVRLGSEEGSSGAAGTAARPTYVGGEACASCHQTEARAWSGSHHDLAMQEATEETVLGDFGGATLVSEGVRWTFLRRGGRFFVRPEGADLPAAEYEVRYTFGVFPLQQYLVAFPGGRFQPLRIAWDARSEGEGGQRWLDLHAGLGIGPDHPLHWTRAEQSWNTACADCHSTNLAKGFEVASRTFATTWSEIDVSCEACHGPGSEHVRAQEGRARRGEAAQAGGAGESATGSASAGLLANPADRGRAWTFGPGARIATRVAPRAVDTEVQTCAHCHGRRALVGDDWRAGVRLLDTDLPALLREDLYHPDGQILDEVYVYGSFVQSRMYRAGVTCSDCHDPHSLTLRAPGNALCTRCHLTTEYDGPSHHFHPEGSPGGECVECHMPATTYMVVDPRRDHSLRVPRPDLSRATGAPNACERCHSDRSTEWAAGVVEGWYGPRDASQPHFSEAIAAGREGDPTAAAALAEVGADTSQAGIVRGTALSLLGRYPLSRFEEVVRAGAADPDPLVRIGAIEALRGRDAPALVELALPLVRDTLRALRVQAAELLAGLPRSSLNPEDAAVLDAALLEYRASREASSDHPTAWVELGDLHALRGDGAAAENAYRTALALDSTHVAAHVNLADLLRAQGRTAAEEEVLRRALEVAADAPEVQHAVGLMRVRGGDLGAALVHLERAARAAPRIPRYAYVFGIALTSAGEMEDAMRVLREAVALHPFDRDLLFALATLSRDRGERATAIDYAERLVGAYPDDTEARRLFAELGGR